MIEMKRFQRVGIGVLIFGLGLLLIGTVVKRKDPIQRTQTDPVGYEDKLKEEAEGKKGPPVPSLNLFPRERFLFEGPVEGRKKTKKISEERQKMQEATGQALEAEFELALDEDLESWEEKRKPLDEEDEEVKLGLELDDTWEEQLDLEL